MESLLVWLILTVLVGYYSRSKGLGFASGFWWSFFLSPVVGALITAVRLPRYRVLSNGTTFASPPRAPDAPRPMFCAVLIIVIFCGILVFV